MIKSGTYAVLFERVGPTRCASHATLGNIDVQHITLFFYPHVNQLVRVQRFPPVLQRISACAHTHRRIRASEHWCNEACHSALARPCSRRGYGAAHGETAVEPLGIIVIRVAEQCEIPRAVKTEIERIIVCDAVRVPQRRRQEPLSRKQTVKADFAWGAG